MHSSGKLPGGGSLEARGPQARLPVNGAPALRDVRLGIVHADRSFRAGVRALLASEAGLSVVAELESLDGVVEVLRDIPCNVLLVYSPLDEQRLATISRLSNQVAIVVVANNQDEQAAMAAVRAGVRSVVLNHLAVDGLVGAIRAVTLGHVSMPPALQAQLVAELRQMSSTPLTSRERDVTRLVAAGMRNAEIARRLAISEQTVKKHLNNIFQKLDLRDRVELARFAMRSTLTGATDGWGVSAAEVREMVARETRSRTNGPGSDDHRA